MSDLVEIDMVAGVPVYKVDGEPKSFIFKAGMMIDCDGSPNAYGPDNSGMDYTANGGTPGENWWGGPTDSKGYPLVQQIYDPSPGLYVSATSHFNPAYPEPSPYRYCNSESLPFIVLPGNHANGAKLGDACFCLNTKTGDNCYGFYGDVGPSAKIGEASMRMAEALKIDSNPKTGGTESLIVVYLVFPGSIGKWTTPDSWFSTADRLFLEWGGASRLKKLIAEL